MRRILYAVATAVAIATGVVGFHHQQVRPHILGFNTGGAITEFIEEYDELRRTGRPVILDGMCMSACTLVVGLIPPQRLCTTPFGKLAFHSAWYQGPFGMSVHASEGTRLIWHIYPEPLRQLLRDRGWNGDNGPADNAHPTMIYVEGSDLLGVIRAC